MKRLMIVVAVQSLLIAGCGSDSLDGAVTDIDNAVENVVDDAAGVAARNFATQQGEEQFRNAGHQLAGPLTCNSEVQQDASSLKIDCTGSTKLGGAAVLSGTTDELPGVSVVMLRGLFVGTVDGAEVFRTDALGG